MVKPYCLMVDDLAQQLLAARLGDLVVEELVGGRAVLVEALHEAQILRDVAVEDDAACGGAHHMADLLAVQLLGDAHPHGLVDADNVLVVGHQRLVLVAVDVQMSVGLLLVGELVVGLAGQREVHALRPQLVVGHLADAVLKPLEG